MKEVCRQKMTPEKENSTGEVIVLQEKTKLIDGKLKHGRHRGTEIHLQTCGTS